MNNGSDTAQIVIYLDVFPKSRGVVVSRRLGISKCLKNGIRSENLTFNFAGIVEGELGFGFRSQVRRVDGRQVTHDEFGLVREYKIPSNESDILLTDSVLPAPLRNISASVLPRSLRSAPFTGNDDCLTLSLLPHCRVRVLRNGEQMRLKIASFSTGVCLDDIGAI